MPEGLPTEATIGAGGGTLASSDGRLNITVPPGALAGDTVIAIQPITATAPGALGTPEDMTFAQPVTLTFTYPADEAAALHARAALAAGDDVSPNDLYPGERWLQAWRALALASAPAEANDALHRGAAWVQQTLREHVSEPFRDSFVRANAVNAQLLRAAASR